MPFGIGLTHTGPRLSDPEETQSSLVNFKHLPRQKPLILR